MPEILDKNLYKIKSLIDDILSEKEETQNLIDLLSEYINLKQFEPYESLINFAWEETDITNRSFELAQKYISTASHIVVIGYSFPIFNKQKDTLLFEGLLKHSDPKSVIFYIQDPKADSLIYKLKSNFGIINNLSTKDINNRSMVITPHTDISQFLTPDDLINN